MATINSSPPTPSIDWNHLRVLQAVSEAGSFSGAAQQLGVPRSTVSRAVAALEEATGTALFQRSTRRIAITDEARQLVERVAPSLQTIEGALHDLPVGQAEPRGTLRITSTADLGSIVLAEAVARFVARWPAVTVETMLTARAIDLVKEGFDLALRVSSGRMQDSSLVAKKVGSVGFRLYAAPSYLQRRGTPRSRTDLSQHDWVGFRNMLLSRIGIEARPRVLCDDMFFVRETVIHGGGLSVMPPFLADEAVARGALVNVLPRWELITGTAYVVRPERKHVPARTQRFAETLVELLRRNPL